MARYAYLWEFLVRPDKASLFERMYGPEGDWVTLFRRAAGYVDTRLLKDRSAADRYVTIDRWESEADYRRFRERFADEYRSLDERCEGLTTEERFLGAYSE